MTLVGRCTFGVTILFWQLVSLGVFGYAMAFLFWPEEANKLFAVPQTNLNIVRYFGALFLFADAGVNQVAQFASGSSRPKMQKMAFMSTLLLYIMSGAAGLVIVTLEDAIFSKHQTFAFQIMYSLFLGALSLGLLGSCAGYCSVKTGSTGLQEIEITVNKPKNLTKLHSGLSRDDIRQGKR